MCLMGLNDDIKHTMHHRTNDNISNMYAYVSYIYIYMLQLYGRDMCFRHECKPLSFPINNIVEEIFDT